MDTDRMDRVVAQKDSPMWWDSRRHSNLTDLTNRYRERIWLVDRWILLVSNRRSVTRRYIAVPKSRGQRWIAVQQYRDDWDDQSAYHRDSRGIDRLLTRKWPLIPWRCRCLQSFPSSTTEQITLKRSPSFSFCTLQCISYEKHVVGSEKHYHAKCMFIFSRSTRSLWGEYVRCRDDDTTEDKMLGLTSFICQEDQRRVYWLEMKRQSFPRYNVRREKRGWNSRMAVTSIVSFVNVSARRIMQENLVNHSSCSRKTSYHSCTRKTSCFLVPSIVKMVRNGT